jgi:hypothetical protein
MKAGFLAAALLFISGHALAQGGVGMGDTYSGVGPRTGPLTPGIQSDWWMQQLDKATNPNRASTNLSPSQKNSMRPKA